MKVLDAIKKFKWGYIFLALITAAIGICFLAFGNDSLNTLAIVIGVVIIVGAIVLAVSALAAKERGFAFGALTFALFLGYLPTHLDLPVLFAGQTWWYAAEAVLSLILLTAGLFACREKGGRAR